MSSPEAHPVRNGVIATVVGGIVLTALGYLWQPARSGAFWLWGRMADCWAALIGSYLVPGWLILLLVGVTVAAAFRFLRSLASRANPPAYLSYIEDTIFGAIWHWSWNDGRIAKLWASCPTCHGELVYVEDPDSYLFTDPRAKFFCEHCRSVVVDIRGRGYDYAKSAVEREIRRRLRIAQQEAPGHAS